MSEENEIYIKKYLVAPSKTPSEWKITPINNHDGHSNETLDCIALAGTAAGTEAKVRFQLDKDCCKDWENLSLTSLHLDEPTEVEMTLFKSVKQGEGFVLKFLNRKGPTLDSQVVAEDFKFSSINRHDGKVFLSEDPKLGTVRPPN